jgi:DNA-binding CsgD family transcriptional regulator
MGGASKVGYKRAVPDSPLLGRTAELTALRRQLDEARAGRGSLVLVTGEAGLGKSRLLAELATAARRLGTAVLTGTALEDAPAYRPVAQALMPVLRAARAEPASELRPYRRALGRLLPDWAEPGDGSLDLDPALVLGEGIVRLLTTAAEDGGWLLVVEDAQWADPDTVSLLEYLASAVRQSRVLVAVAARDDAAGVQVVSRLESVPGVARVALSLLPAAEIERLAAVRSGGRLTAEQVAHVVAQAAGLPLLAEELAAALVAGAAETGSSAVPAGFAAQVHRRLDALGVPARSILQAAATLGTEPDWTVLPDITRSEPDQVWSAFREAVAHQLLVQDASGLRWRHALTREAVAATVLQPEQAQLARRTADLLLTRGRPDDDEHAARMLLLAGDRRRAVQVAERAAVRHRRRAAYGSADRVLHLGEAAGGSTGLTSERVLLLCLTGQPVLALETGEPALEKATGDEHAELCLRLARAAVEAGRWRDAERHVARAGRPDDPRSATLAADAAHGDGRVEEAAGFATRAVELAEAAGDPDALVAALVAAGRIARLSDVQSATRFFARAAQVAAEHGLTAARVQALIGLGTLELLEQERSRSLETAHELALDLGLLSAALSVDVLLCDALLLAAGPSAAKDPVSRLLASARSLRLEGLQAVAGVMLAVVHAAEDEPAALEERLAEVQRIPGQPPDLVAMTHAARAYAALFAHDLSTAVDLLDRGVPLLLAHAPSAPLPAIGAWVLVRTVAGDDGSAREQVRHLVSMRRPANQAALWYAEAVAAGRAGHADQAAGAFARADACLPASAWWRRVLRLVALECAVTDGWGDPVRELRANLAGHEANGEERLAVTCRDLLRRAGAPTRRGRGTGPVPAGLRAVGVTSRELDVLRLVRDGLGNAEIAERLFLSVRTVETHVAHLLAKSGTSDRTALASWSLSAWPRDQDQTTARS